MFLDTQKKTVELRFFFFFFRFPDVVFCVLHGEVEREIKNFIKRINQSLNCRQTAHSGSDISF